MEVEIEKPKQTEIQEIPTDLVSNLNEFKRPERLNCSLCLNIYLPQP